MFFLTTILKFLRRLFVTIWFWSGAIIATVALGICMVLSGTFTHDNITANIETIMADIIFLWMTVPGFWKLEVSKMSSVKDEDVKQSKGPFLLAANHNSIIDTLFMAKLPYRKTYTFNLKWSWVPIFGQLCVYAGYIGIDTSSSEQKAKVVPKIIDKMKEGYSIMIYPQGTRSLTPEDNLYPSHLKHGTFSIAKEGKFKIMPFAIKGSNKALMRGGWADIATIELIQCAPFEVEEVEQGKIDFCRAINSALNAPSRD